MKLKKKPQKPKRGTGETIRYSPCCGERLDEVVAYFAGLDIPTGDITYEIEREYYDGELDEVVFYARKIETDEEYDVRMRDYKARLAKWQVWRSANSKEIIIEEKKRAQERKERRTKQRDKDEIRAIAQLEAIRRRRI